MLVSFDCHKGEYAKLMGFNNAGAQRPQILVQLSPSILLITMNGKLQTRDLTKNCEIMLESDEAADFPVFVKEIHRKTDSRFHKDHPLGNYSVVSLSYRKEFILWNVDFKRKDKIVEAVRVPSNVKNQPLCFL
jgi:hypothetical protein